MKLNLFVISLFLLSACTTNVYYETPKNISNSSISINEEIFDFEILSEKDGKEISVVKDGVEGDWVKGTLIRQKNTNFQDLIDYIDNKQIENVYISQEDVELGKLLMKNTNAKVMIHIPEEDVEEYQNSFVN